MAISSVTSCTIHYSSMQLDTISKFSRSLYQIKYVPDPESIIIKSGLTFLMKNHLFCQIKQGMKDQTSYLILELSLI